MPAAKPKAFKRSDKSVVEPGDFPVDARIEERRRWLDENTPSFKSWSQWRAWQQTLPCPKFDLPVIELER